MMVRGAASSTDVDAVLRIFDGATIVELERSMSSRTARSAPAALAAPVVGRGVLLDVPAAFGVDALAEGHVVTEVDLMAATVEQRVELNAGDCVLVRTGPARSGGLGEDAATWIAEHAPYVCGVDFRFDSTSESMSVREILIDHAGARVADNLDLEELARLRCTEFLFAYLPTGPDSAAQQPPRAMALRF